MLVSWRRLLLSVGLSLGLLLFLRQVWTSYEAVQHYELCFFQPAYLLAALALSLLVYALQMFAWAMIMRYLGFAFSLRQTFHGYLLSFLPRYIPGSLWGYWSRSQWLEQYCGVDHATSRIGSILEALSLILTALSMAAMYLHKSSTGFKRYLLAATWIGLLGLACLVLPRLVTRLCKGKLRSHSRKGHAVYSWFTVVALHTALWVIYGGSILLIGNALLSTPSRGLLQTAFSSSLSWVLGFVVIVVPAGIGVRELTLAKLLSVHSSLLPWQADLVAIISRFEIILAELGWLMVGLGIHVSRWWKGSNQCKLFLRRGGE